MRDDASLEVADVVGRVVHKLNMPDAALMSLTHSGNHALVAARRARLISKKQRGVKGY